MKLIAWPTCSRGAERRFPRIITRDGSSGEAMAGDIAQIEAIHRVRSMFPVHTGKRSTERKHRDTMLCKIAVECPLQLYTAEQVSGMRDSSWQVFDLEEVTGRLEGKSVEYLEFLNVPAVSCGVYFLAAGSKDMQAPHDDDEVYLVLSGRARMRLGDTERSVGPGSLLYVSATTQHSFFEIEEDMTLLVVFASSPRERG